MCNIQVGGVIHETIKESQFPKHELGLDVTLRVTQCAGCISANTRTHQLHWGTRTCTVPDIHVSTATCVGMVMWDSFTLATSLVMHEVVIAVMYNSSLVCLPLPSLHHYDSPGKSFYNYICLLPHPSHPLPHLSCSSMLCISSPSTTTHW